MISSPSRFICRKKRKVEEKSGGMDGCARFPVTINQFSSPKSGLARISASHAPSFRCIGVRAGVPHHSMLAGTAFVCSETSLRVTRASHKETERTNRLCKSLFCRNDFGTAGTSLARISADNYCSLSLSLSLIPINHKRSQ